MSADRTEATTALIEWEVLSLEDLRGNLSSHEIVYYKLLDEDCPPNTTSSSRMVSFKGIEPQFVITDLDPGLQYCVGVAAKTGAGHGDFSYSLIPCKYIVLNQNAKHNSMCVCVRNVYLFTHHFELTACVYYLIIDSILCVCIMLRVLSLWMQGIATACLLWCCWKSYHAQSGL